MKTGDFIMFKISNAVAGLATLALATLPMLASASSAQAAPVSVQVADLDLNTTDGAQAFKQRVDVAAREFCRQAAKGQRGLRDNRNCEQAVREEAAEKAATWNEAMLANAKSATLASR
jgi:UrcA family protein